MPMPVDNATWPPKPLTEPLRVFSEHAAWYSGDTERLANLYEDADSTADGSRSWRFWARRRPSGGIRARRERLHVPVPGDIAATSADLLFGSEFDFVIPGIRDENPPSGVDELQERLNTIIFEGGTHNRLLEGAEQAAALGGIYLRPMWDRDLSDVPFLTVVSPDMAAPTFRFGMLSEVTFWRVISDPEDDHVMRHIEHHAPGRFENALFVGTDDKLGRRLDLEDSDWTRDLEEVVETGLDGLAVRYVKNMGPARRLAPSPHGRSDFDGIEDLFDAIDETMNSWMRDIRLGKARIFASRDVLERATGGGAFFDVDQEVFTPLEIPPDASNSKLVDSVQFKIRFEEHRDTFLHLVEQAVGNAGYSAQTFGVGEDGGAMTATEIRARTSKTSRTLEKKRRYWQPEVEAAGEILLHYDRLFLGNKHEVARPTIEWPDTSAPDAKSLAETLDLLARAEAASTETLVRMQHPDWSEQEVTDEVARIIDQTGRRVANPFPIGDVDPEEPEPDELEGDE